MNEDGTFNEDVTDPIIIELFCSSRWHYDGDTSPRGWSSDAFVDEGTRLIDLERITVPTPVMYGTNDPYMNQNLLREALDELPEGSEMKKISSIDV